LVSLFVAFIVVLDRILSCTDSSASGTATPAGLALFMVSKPPTQMGRFTSYQSSTNRRKVTKTYFIIGRLFSKAEPSETVWEAQWDDSSAGQSRPAHTAEKNPDCE